MTQTENAAPSTDDVAVYILQTHVGDIDGPRTVQLVRGTWADVRERVDSMNETLRLVYGRQDAIEISADGPHELTELSPTADQPARFAGPDDPFDYAELGRERAEQLATELSRAAQSLHALSASSSTVADARGVMLKVMSVLSAASQGLDLEKETC